MAGLFWLLSGVVLAALFVTGAVWLALYDLRTERRPVNLAVLTYGLPFFLHTCSCIGAGIYGGDLVTGREVRRGTFTLLQLAACEPLRFLAAKLLPPLALLGVVWATGIPLALCGALLELGSISTVVRACGLAAFAGLAALALTLLITTETWQKGQTTLRSLEFTLPETLATFSVLIGVWLVFALITTAWTAPDRWPWFGLRVPVWWVAGPVLLCMLAQAGSLCLRELTGKAWPCAHAIPLGVVGIGAVYVAALGGLWTILPWWISWPLGVGLPALLAISFAHAHRGSPGASTIKLPAADTSSSGPTIPVPKPNRRVAAELTWIAERWSNPLLLRDLRGVLRKKSLRRRLLGACLWAPIRLGFFYFLIRHFSAGIGIFASSLSQPLFHGGNSAATLWGKEQRQGTLASVLLTPLTSREILAGRLAASVAVAFPDFLISLLVLIGATGWLAWTKWLAGPLTLLLCPLLLAEWVAMACHGATPGMSRDVWRPSFLWITTAIGGLLLVFGSIAAVVNASQRFGLPAAYGVAFGCGLLHAATSLLVFSYYAQRLDAYRNGNIVEVGD